MEVSNQPQNTITLPDPSPEATGYWLAFHRVRGIGPVAFRLLLNHFQDDLALAWQANEQELIRAGLSSRGVTAILAQRDAIEPQREIEQLSKAQVDAITLRDPAYPPLLREIDSAPPVLYIRGTLTVADQFALAIVGTRNTSSYGQFAAEQMATELALGKVTIVSGLALGIDTIAHRAALDAGGRTIAILACGLNTIYPAKNTQLAHRIVESGQGALLSEYPFNVPPESRFFPARNRLISGLSQGVLVVEAGERSGALITADFALKQGREVVAIPGNIDSSRSQSTNKLIQDGAQPVHKVKDILDALNLFMVPQQMEVQLAHTENEEERTLLNLLNHEPIHIDELILASNLPASTVISTLTMLELKGLVKTPGHSQFILAR